MPKVWFQSTPTGFPAGDVFLSLLKLPQIDVSIHADRFPGRRLTSSAILVVPRRFNPRRPVSRPATPSPATPPSAAGGFNPRRPVSRPATRRQSAAGAGGQVSIHADRFPGRRPQAVQQLAGTVEFQSTPTGFPAGDAWDYRRQGFSEEFQSTPTGFPAGDDRDWFVRESLKRFNPRRPVSRPATYRSGQKGMAKRVSIHADRFPGRRRRASNVLSGLRKPGGFREPGRLTTPVGCLVGGVEHGLPCKSVTCAVREPPG